MAHVERMPAGDAARRLDATIWGLFFVWIGVALVANVGWGVSLLGVGLITLGGQAARRYVGLAVERFWVVVGVLLVVGAAWELASVRFSLVPVVLIAAGVALLVSATQKPSA